MHRSCVVALILVAMCQLSMAQTVSFTEYPIPLSGGTPSGIVKGPDGALWFTWISHTQGTQSQIGRITTSGSITLYPLTATCSLSGGPCVSPGPMTVGPDGAIWVPGENNLMYRITVGGVITTLPMPLVAPGSGYIQPSAMTAGPDGNLWFGSYLGVCGGTYNIWRFTTTGTATPFPLPAADSTGPLGITTGPDGALWFTEAGQNCSGWTGVNKIGRITTSGSVTEFVLPSGSFAPADGIVTGPDGALWFTATYYQGPGQIGRITTSGTITIYPAPSEAGEGGGITAGPDGALWFTEALSANLGRITTAGVVTQFPISGTIPRFSGGGGITVGPDGALWFTDTWNPNTPTLGNGIVRAVITNPPPPSLASISPSAATAGGPAFTLTVNGSGFVSGSVVQWNGSSLSTTYVSPTQLTASVSAAQIANQGSASVTVVNAGSAPSNSLTFTIAAPTPSVSISGLIPNSAVAGGLAFTLTVNGSGFLVGAAVQWNGSALSTTFVSSTQLTASVPASQIASPGTASVRVVNPGGATSNAITLAINALGTPVRVGSLAHIAAGGGWTTVITIVNTSASPVALTVALHADDGSAISLPVTMTQQGITQTTTASSINAALNPNTTVLISTGDQLAQTVVGWADVLSSGPVGGFAIFRSTPNTGSPSEGTVPLQTQTPVALVLPYDNTAGFVMGVALANLSASSATITATMWDDSGILLGSQGITVAGSGHTSFVLPTQLPLTSGKRGIVRFQSSGTGGLTGLGLRFSPFGTFTSVPTILP